MRAFRLLVIVPALAIGATSIVVRASDTDSKSLTITAQIRSRTSLKVSSQLRP